MRKRMTIVLAVVMAAMTITVAAPAQETDSATPEALLQGAGHLFAVGHGVAVLDGAGYVRMVLNGDAVIVDHAGDARIKINDRPDLPLAETDEAEDGGTKIVLRNFEGRIRVAGSDWTIEVSGTTVFFARGRGAAFLQGTGIYHTRAGWGFWSSSGVRVEAA